MKRLVAFALLGVLVTQPFAQQNPVGITARAMLVASPDVKKELKITKDQDKRILEAMKQHSEEMKSGTAPFNFADPMSAFDEVIGQILEDAQKVRLEQLFIQANGPFALADSKVAETVGLADDQKAKAKEISDEAQAAGMDKMRSARSRGAMDAIKKMRNDYGERIKALLTPDQAKKIKDLEGKPFKFRT